MKLFRGQGGAGERGLLEVASYPVVSNSFATKPLDYYAVKWSDFKNIHGETYSRAVEEQQRYEKFKVNVNYSSTMNSKNATGCDAFRRPHGTRIRCFALWYRKTRCVVGFVAKPL